MNTNTINTPSSVNANAPVLGVDSGQSGEAIGQLNELMVQLGQLFGKLRDILRQYNQVQQQNAFNMQKTSFDTRMVAIEKDFDAKTAQAAAQVAGGCFQAVAGSIAAYTGISPIAETGKGVETMTQGFVNLGWANKWSRESEEGKAKAEYQEGLAQQLLKRSDETMEKALKVSSDLREILSTLTQAHERIASSVRMQ